MMFMSALIAKLFVGLFGDPPPLRMSPRVTILALGIARILGANFLAGRGCNPTDIICALKHLQFGFVDALLVLELCFTQILIVGL